MSQHQASTVPTSRRWDIEVSTPAARLSLAPGSGAPSHVDGAWWPRSTDLVAELPALLDAVRDRTGDVAFVGFHRGAWQPARGVDLAHGSIWLEGFTSDEPHTVIVIGSSGQRLTLTVLAPDTAREAALEELAAASNPEPATGAGAHAGNTRSLDEVAARLASMDDLTNELRAETIEQWVHEAAAEFIEAPVQVFVPILVEHIVRQKMTSNPLIPRATD